MRYELLDSLGTVDAKYCNTKLGASIDVSKTGTLAAGNVIGLPDAAAAYLTKKYPALLKPLETMRAQAKPADIQGVTERSESRSKREKPSE
jgi:hypothetical protein